MAKPTIGFLGLGTMGIGMARRLLSDGYSLRVYNRNLEKARALAGEGATAANSPAEAVVGCEVVISMVADDAASRAMWQGEQGALSAVGGGGAGTILVECSTLSVPWIRELAQAAEGRKCPLLDAPVTGTKPHAAAGELTFLVGGDAGVLERVRPILSRMSKDIVHVGPSGSGAAMKLINNFVCGVQAAALAEGNALARLCGLDPERALRVLSEGAPGSPVVKQLVARHAKQDYTPNFKLRLMAKDIGYAIDEAGRHQLSLPTASAALGTFKQAMGANLGDEDFAALIKFVQPAGGETYESHRINLPQMNTNEHE